MRQNWRLVPIEEGFVNDVSYRDSLLRRCPRYQIISISEFINGPTTGENLATKNGFAKAELQLGGSFT